MNDLIFDILKRKGRVTTADLVRGTGLSRAYAQRFLKELTEEGSIIRVGKANQAHYILAAKKGGGPGVASSYVIMRGNINMTYEDATLYSF
jgi:predicted transcriptional regulator